MHSSESAARCLQSINAGAAGARISCDGVAGSDRVIRGRPPAQPGLPDAETLASQDVAVAVPPPPARTPVDADTVDSHESAASRRFGETLPDATTTTTRAGARAIGASIGRYVLLAKLGEGGMGEVYSGYDQELNRRVALKVVRSRRADDAIGRARTQREAQALARLSHPNVVQVHDVGEMGGELFVAMEYVEGETLRAWQKRHDPATPAGRRAILDMYMQAGRGLAAAHDAGIVHRDFKPESGLASQVVENTSVPRLRRWYVPTVYQARGPRQDRALWSSCEIAHGSAWRRWCRDMRWYAPRTAEPVKQAEKFEVIDDDPRRIPPSCETSLGGTSSANMLKS